MDDIISRQAAVAVADSSDYVGLSVEDVKKVTDEVVKGLKRLPSAQPGIIKCEDCMHNGSFDTDCPIDWAGKEYCSFAERLK